MQFQSVELWPEVKEEGTIIPHDLLHCESYEVIYLYSWQKKIVADNGFMALCLTINLARKDRFYHHAHETLINL